MFLKNLLDRFGPQLSLDTSDTIYALMQLPTKISLIMNENEELRVENAQKTIALGKMSSNYEIALAENTKKIKDLEAEVKKQRVTIEELMKKGRRKNREVERMALSPRSAHRLLTRSINRRFTSVVPQFNIWSYRSWLSS
ncbi:hypothetical protein PMAYCL1PPCAC_22448 [Pristionchus mayeri]|uniref:Uncharacterized protein n=1 Tax=Pristionchus mayeri TaxID=1317129 RepID=A0AAN5CWS9_9BILA|nr:hypothetical protein PMAYCL1PPCAC_22448 [Pristionchus mayeri]